MNSAVIAYYGILRVMGGGLGKISRNGGIAGRHRVIHAH